MRNFFGGFEMRNLALSSALGALIFVGCGNAAFATTYDFTYSFAGDGVGNTVTGSFTGTGGINDIAVDSVLSMALNGIAVIGQLSAYSYTAPAGGGNNGTFTPGNAIVSNDSSQSNFLFSTAGYSTYFYVIQPWYNPASQTIATQYASPSAIINYYNGQYVPGNFSVAAVPGPIAGAGLPALLGLLGFGLYRRQRPRSV